MCLQRNVQRLWYWDMDRLYKVLEGQQKDLHKSLLDKLHNEIHQCIHYNQYIPL